MISETSHAARRNRERSRVYARFARSAREGRRGEDVATRHGMRVSLSYAAFPAKRSASRDHYPSPQKFPGKAVG